MEFGSLTGWYDVRLTLTVYAPRQSVFDCVPGSFFSSGRHRLAASVRGPKEPGFKEKVPSPFEKKQGGRGAGQATGEIVD